MSPIQPSNLHPFDEYNTQIPKLNHISPSPVNLPAVIETDHLEKENDGLNTPTSRMQLKGMRRRSSGEPSHEGDMGKPEPSGMATAGGLTATRPHLTALSPLQSFSPLNPQADGLANPPRSRTHSRTPSWQSQTGGVPGPSLANSPVLSTPGGLQQLNTAQGLRAPFGSSPKSAPVAEGNEEKGQGAEGLSRSRSNASSVTRSLSRRQSFAASRASLTELNTPVERGQGGPTFHSHQGGLISKLMIVKAPSNKDAQGDKGKRTDEVAGNRR